MSALELRSLCKRFGEKIPVDGLSCTIPAGALAVVAGPSGAGKTTLLRLIAGLELPDAGEVWIGGRCASGNRCHVPPQRRGLAFVFQEPALWPHLTVRGHLEYVLRARGVSKAERPRKVEAALALVELEPEQNMRPATLSGGQQQRLNIARALVAMQPLILLDEPFAHLDSRLRDKLLQAILGAQAAGATVVLAAHRHEDLQLEPVLVLHAPEARDGIWRVAD